MSALKSVSKPSSGRENISWPVASSLKQNLNFPNTIIYYITKNPTTSNVYLKLAKSCKYFFETNPILIVKHIHNRKSFICINETTKCHEKNPKCCIDIKKLSNKIWLTDWISLSQDDTSNIASLLVPKIYRCENAQLFKMDSVMTFEEHKIWATVFQKFHLVYLKIINTDGSAVMLDEILQSISIVKEFEYWFEYEKAPTATNITIKNIMNLPNISNLRYLSLVNIPEGINLEDLVAFIKKHKDTKFHLEFFWHLSEEYRKKLAQVIDNLIESNTRNTLIKYPWQDEEKYKILENLYYGQK